MLDDGTTMERHQEPFGLAQVRIEHGLKHGRRRARGARDRMRDRIEIDGLPEDRNVRGSLALLALGAESRAEGVATDFGVCAQSATGGASGGPQG